MAREKSIHVCSECGGTNPKWLGQCPHCKAWNTLVETVAEPTGGARHRFQSLAKAQPVATLSEIEATDIERAPTGVDELDRVLGGGMVAGGVVLIGGDPGIGKSTLLLQALDSLSRGSAALYVTGEEAAPRWRCARTGSAWAVRRARAGRDPPREDPGRHRGRAAGRLRHRLDPDPVLGPAHLGARLGGPGARVRGPADAHWPRPAARPSCSSAT
jgi:hypothetical protein